MGLRKASAQELDRRAAEIARELGAIDTPGIFGNELTLQTRAGPLYIHPSTRPCRGKRTGLFTVFCRFENMEALRTTEPPFLGLIHHVNPFTGKYNLHTTVDDQTLDLALADFRQHLRATLPRAQEPETHAETTNRNRC